VSAGLVPFLLSPHHWHCIRLHRRFVDSAFEVVETVRFRTDWGRAATARLSEMKTVNAFKNLAIAALTASLLSTAYAGEVIRSKAETKAQLISYWMTHDSRGLECADTSATSLYDIGGRKYATFTVQAREKLTKFPLTLGFVYDVDAKIMFALWPNQMAEFIKTGNQSILKSSLGSESVDLG
jgi:hypothetical protein